MKKPKDFLQACRELAEDSYVNHTGKPRRRAYLSELLEISKFYHSDPEHLKIQNLDSHEFNYFVARSQLTESHLKHTLKDKKAYFDKCNKDWNPQGFRRIFNDVGDRYDVNGITILGYKSFDKICELDIKRDDFFIHINNVDDIPAGDYYFIFELTDLWTGQCSEFAYFMDFVK